MSNGTADIFLGMMIKRVLLFMAAVIGLCVLGVWLATGPSRHGAEKQVTLDSYTRPIKVLAIHYERSAGNVCFWEDGRGRRGKAEMDDEVLIVGDEIELFLSSFNHVCARRTYHED